MVELTPGPKGYTSSGGSDNTHLMLDLTGAGGSGDLDS